MAFDQRGEREFLRVLRTLLVDWGRCRTGRMAFLSTYVLGVGDVTVPAQGNWSSKWYITRI